jgi:hypothetical protein
VEFRRNSVLRLLGEPDALWQPRLAQVDALATHRDALLKQELALPSSHRDAPIRPDYAVPWKSSGRGGEDVTDQAGSSRLDVAVGAYKSNGDCAYPSDDAY